MYNKTNFYVALHSLKVCCNNLSLMKILSNILQVSMGVRYKLNTYVYYGSNAQYQQEIVNKFHKFVTEHNFDGVNLQIEELELGYDHLILYFECSNFIAKFLAA